MKKIAYIFIVLLVCGAILSLFFLSASGVNSSRGGSKSISNHSSSSSSVTVYFSEPKVQYNFSAEKTRFTCAVKIPQSLSEKPLVYGFLIKFVDEDRENDEVFTENLTDSIYYQNGDHSVVDIFGSQYSRYRMFSFITSYLITSTVEVTPFVYEKDSNDNVVNRYYGKSRTLR